MTLVGTFGCSADQEVALDPTGGASEEELSGGGREGSAALRVDSPPPCKDGGACEGAFAMGGTVFGVSCRIVDEGEVDREPFAVGPGFSAYRVLDSEPSVTVAVRGDWFCEGTSDQWNAASPTAGAAPTSAFEQAWCQAGQQRPDPAQPFDCGG